MKRFVINTLDKKSRISREIYGHFSEHLGRCIYEGLYVGEDNTDIPSTNGMRNDVIEALKAIKVPVLRWPGGCFADEYHWMDGIGSRQSRKKMINTHWGGVIEDNSFGTHEFMELCRQIGCEPYISGNLGSGSVREMSEWIEYMTFSGHSPLSSLREKNGHKEPWSLKYFGIGNESWGCGGNMTPAYYADEFRRYSSYCRNYADQPLYKIACGANADDYAWTEEVMKNLCSSDCCTEKLINGISLHYYTVPGGFEHKKSATAFSVSDYDETISRANYMDTLISRHSDILNQYDPEKKIGLIVDEWGTWYEAEPGTNPGFLYQQNTMRDALTAGITLNIFNKHSDRVRMANLAQLINVLQAVMLTDGNRMIKTPTYYVFDLYTGHMNADLLNTSIENEMLGNQEYSYPMISESASMDENGDITLTVVNASLEKNEEIEVLPVAFRTSSLSASILTDEVHAHNTFDDCTRVQKKPFKDCDVRDNGSILIRVPACSVLSMKLMKQ